MARPAAVRIPRMTVQAKLDNRVDANRLTSCQPFDMGEKESRGRVSMDEVAALGRRERQIMEIVYRRGRATAADVLGDLPDPPTYTAVRGMLRHLEDKGSTPRPRSRSWPRST